MLIELDPGDHQHPAAPTSKNRPCHEGHLVVAASLDRRDRRAVLVAACGVRAGEHHDPHVVAQLLAARDACTSNATAVAALSSR